MGDSLLLIKLTLKTTLSHAESQINENMAELVKTEEKKIQKYGDRIGTLKANDLHFGRLFEAPGKSDEILE